MSETKISKLEQGQAVSLEDILVIVQNVNGTLETRNITVNELLASLGTIRLQGEWDASSGAAPQSQTTPIPSGFAWRVSVDGTTNVDEIHDWNIGDLIVKTEISWIKVGNNDVGAIWGNIKGTITNQTDLIDLLNTKASKVVVNQNGISQLMVLKPDSTGGLIGSGIYLASSVEEFKTITEYAQESEVVIIMTKEITFNYYQQTFTINPNIKDITILGNKINQTYTDLFIINSGNITINFLAPLQGGSGSSLRIHDTSETGAIINILSISTGSGYLGFYGAGAFTIQYSKSGQGMEPNTDENYTFKDWYYAGAANESSVLKKTNNLSDLQSRQTALNNLTDVNNASGEYVLTKDGETGDAIWKPVISYNVANGIINNNNTFELGGGLSKDTIIGGGGNRLQFGETNSPISPLFFHTSALVNQNPNTQNINFVLSNLTAEIGEANGAMYKMLLGTGVGEIAKGNSYIRILSDGKAFINVPDDDGSYAKLEVLGNTGAFNLIAEDPNISSKHTIQAISNGTTPYMLFETSHNANNLSLKLLTGDGFIFKDGVLKYYSDLSAQYTDMSIPHKKYVDDLIDDIVSTKGQANGLATLDINGKIVSSQLPDSILGQVSFIALWDALTDTPTLPDATTVKGSYYKVSIAGTYNNIDFNIGDWIISDGIAWSKVDNTEAVSSVQGKTGNVIITKADIGLEFVNNTSDANKPISVAQTTVNNALQTAINNEVVAREQAVLNLQNQLTANKTTYQAQFHLINGRTLQSYSDFLYFDNQVKSGNLNGLNSNDCVPYFIPSNAVIKSIQCFVGYLGVSNLYVENSVVDIEFEVYKMNMSNATLISNIILNTSGTTSQIGSYNNYGSNTLAANINKSNLNIPLNQGDMIGIRFKNDTTNSATKASAIKYVMIKLIIENV